jgi:short-subunit dehydrogenase
MSSFGPAPGLGTYGATKHAVLGYTSSLQGDLAVAGIPIRTHALCPDTVETGLVHEQEKKPDAVLLFSTPRLLGVDEVADRAVELLDSKAMIASIPRFRAALMRVIGSAPRLGLALLPVLRRLAERERAKR